MTRIGSIAVVATLTLASATFACKKEEKAAAPTAEKTPAPAAPEKAPAPAAEPAAPAAPAPLTGKLQLPNKVPAVGAKVSSSDEMNLHMSIDAKGHKMEMTQSKVEKRDYEILAVSAEAPTKVKVTYTERAQKQSLDGKDKSKPDPLSGHTYVVEAKDGKLVATREGGSIGADETKALEKEWKSLGQVDKMGKLMTSRAFTVGERVTLSGDEMKALMEDSSDKSVVVDAAITLTSVEGGKATFAMEMTFQAKDGPPMSIPLKGTVIVDSTNGWPLAFDMAGPLKGEANGATFDGEMKAKKTFQYQ